MRAIDADKLKRKAQECATEAWKMNLTARIETVLNQFIDWIDKAPTIEPHCEACEAFNKTRLLIPQPQQQKGKLMRRRTFEEMITYFNQTVSDMDIDRKYKITLLGIVTALLQKHDEDVAQIEPQRKRGKWIYGESEAGNDGYYCSKCGNFVPWKYDEYDIDFIKEFLFCNKCGADMTEGEG